MSQNYRYPSTASSTVSIPAIGANGAPIPGSSILIGARDPSTNLAPLLVDSNGALIITPYGGTIPISGTVKAQLQTDNGTSINFGQNTSSFSLPVVIANDQSPFSVSVSSSALPSGAATESTLSTINGKLNAGFNLANNSLSVVIATDQTVPVSFGSLPLPTGAATEATLAALNSKFFLGANPLSQSVSVNISTDQLPLSVAVSSSALPSGAATEATLATIASQTSGLAQESTLGTIASQTAGLATEATLASRLSGSLVPAAYDEIDLTYIPSGPGTGQIGTAVYKLATVTIKTLTLTYDGSDRLSSVVAS